MTTHTHKQFTQQIDLKFSTYRRRDGAATSVEQREPRAWDYLEKRRKKQKMKRNSRQGRIQGIQRARKKGFDGHGRRDGRH
jgi:hypothetical protein